MSKLYEVYFELAQPASIVVEAEDEEGAEDALAEMSEKELMQRFYDAFAMGYKITEVEEVE